VIVKGPGDAVCASIAVRAAARIATAHAAVANTRLVFDISATETSHVKGRRSS
jgi:hypothetical protein